MLTSDGRTLHVQQSGDHGPTVIFEAGMGISRSMWGAVLPELTGIRTLAYDRSGLGRSPGADDDRSLRRLAADLGEVINGVDGPVVLVGHSWGGPIIRRALDTAGGRVVAAVLVDPTDEGCQTYLTRGFAAQTRVGAHLTPLLARLGVLRAGIERQSRSLPDGARAAMRAEDGTAAAARTMAAEMTSSLADIAELRSTPPRVPTFPVTVITGTVTGRAGRRRRDELIAAHTAYTHMLPRGRHVLAPQSGHMVPLTEPKLVAAEIQRILRNLDRG